MKGVESTKQNESDEKYNSTTRGHDKSSGIPA